LHISSRRFQEISSTPDAASEQGVAAMMQAKEVLESWWLLASHRPSWYGAVMTTVFGG